MSIIHPDTPLAELVTTNPALAPTLARLGLDYCCGGRRGLADAATAAGLDPDAVTAELAAVEVRDGGDDWADLGLAELVDHIEATHHVWLHEALPRLDALVQKVAGVHAGRHPELVDVGRLVGEIQADLAPHLMKEERVLFPMIRQLAAATVSPTFHCGSLANPIRAMLMEHDMVGELLAQLRAVTDGYAVPDDGCISYRMLYDGLRELEADTHLHVHKENNVLFPAVLAAERSLAQA